MITLLEKEIAGVKRKTHVLKGDQLEQLDEREVRGFATIAEKAAEMILADAKGA